MGELLWWPGRSLRITWESGSDASSQMMDFQREIKSLTRLPWVRKISWSSAPISDLRVATGFTPLPAEGGGKEQEQKLLMGREVSCILGWEASLFPAHWNPCWLSSPYFWLQWVQWVSPVVLRWVDQYNGFQGNCLTSPRFPFSSTCLQIDPKKCFWFPGSLLSLP